METTWCDVEELMKTFQYSTYDHKCSLVRREGENQVCGVLRLAPGDTLYDTIGYCKYDCGNYTMMITPRKMFPTPPFSRGYRLYLSHIGVHGLKQPRENNMCGL